MLSYLGGIMRIIFIEDLFASVDNFGYHSNFC